MFKKIIGVGVVVSVLALTAVAVASADAGEGRICRAEVAASVLEMDVETVQAERDAGVSIRELFAENDVTEEEIQAALASCLDDMVDAGTITQVEADEILASDPPQRGSEEGDENRGPGGRRGGPRPDSAQAG